MNSDCVPLKAVAATGLLRGNRVYFRHSITIDSVIIISPLIVH